MVPREKPGWRAMPHPVRSKGKSNLGPAERFAAKIDAELYELPLKQGDELLLYVGDQIPEAVVLPVPIDPARSNPYVDNSGAKGTAKGTERVKGR